MLPDLSVVARDAFGATPDTRFLYVSHSHRQALDSLFHGIEGDRPFVVLTGEPGTGKTTLLFHLLKHYLKTAQTAFIFQSQCTPRELMHYVLADCDVPCAGDGVPEMHEQFNQLLVSTFRAGKRFLLLLDEAQNFPHDTLEAVRLLSDFETPNKKLLQIVFSGQPSFEEALASPAMLQLRQRISVYCSLDPLTREETNGYIAHRLKVIGRSDELFSRTSLHMIFDVTRGIPREIHNVCFQSLCLAGECGARKVDCEMVGDSARRLRMPTPEKLYVDEQADSVATAAVCASPTQPQRVAASPAVSIASVPEPTFADAAVPTEPDRPKVPAKPDLPKVKEPQTDPELDSFRYLFEPAKDRPVQKPVTAKTPLRNKRMGAVLVGGCTVVLLLVWVAVTGTRDVTGLKGKLLSVAEARVESPPPATAVTVPLQATVPARQTRKSNEKPVARSASTPLPQIAAPVPQIAANLPSELSEAAANTAEVPPPAPFDLSTFAARDHAKQLLATAEPATKVRLNAPAKPSQVVRSNLIVSPMPAYPEEARRLGIHGVVELEAVIDTKGKLKDIRVVKGHPLLIREAIKAAERQEYTPFLLNSVPQEVPTRVRFVFKP